MIKHCLTLLTALYLTSASANADNTLRFPTSIKNVVISNGANDNDVTDEWTAFLGFTTDGDNLPEPLISDSKWLSLVNNMTTGIKFVDENTGKYLFFPKEFLASEGPTVCSNIYDVPSLVNSNYPKDNKSIILLHFEMSGCDAIGRDYTYIMSKHQPNGWLYLDVNYDISNIATALPEGDHTGRETGNTDNIVFYIK